MRGVRRGNEGRLNLRVKRRIMARFRAAPHGSWSGYPGLVDGGVP
jgi:hypothetical protein